MEFYHILTSIQKILREITSLENLAMRLDTAASDTTGTTTMTTILTTTPIATTTTSAIVNLMPTRDQPQPKNRTEKNNRLEVSDTNKDTIPMI